MAMVGRRHIKESGQTTAEYALFAGIAFIVGLLFHNFSTPFAAALFYGDQGQMLHGEKNIAKNVGLERAMARPIP